VVDDGSTDGTRCVVEAIARTDGRVRYVYQENRERGAARNYGAQLSRGQWVCFLDSDDKFLSTHLEALRDAINNELVENILISRYSFVQNGVRLSNEADQLRSGRIPLQVLLRGNPFACNFAIKNDRYCPLLFREERSLSTMEDWIFLSMHCESAGLRLLESKTVVMREHEGRSVRDHQRLVTSRLAATDFLLKQLNISGFEKNRLKSYSAYFCSVHFFLMGERVKSFRQFQSFIYGPIPIKYKLMQLLRIIIGPLLWEHFKLLRSVLSR
jgi:glycosyltransferase involved in cell wall biosynthesis